jgi:basic membrane lipoprotein Med (substrate-binding protein (PBP1-ABC) superfamily)
LWDQIYKLCLKILQSSLKLIYSSNQEILKYLDTSLESALTDFKKAESSILLLTYFSQQENLKKILGQGDDA